MMFGQKVQKVVEMFPWVAKRFPDTQASAPEAPSAPAPSEAHAPRGDVELGRMSVGELEQMLTRIAVAKKVAAVREEYAGINRNRVSRLVRTAIIAALVVLGFSYSSSESDKERLPIRKVPIAAAAAPVLGAVPGTTAAGHIAVIKLSGEINGALLGAPTPANTPLFLETALAAAEKNPNLAGVILEIDSPGGSAVASEQAYRVVKAARERLGKRNIRIIAYTSLGAYSGGYYIAMGVGKGNFFADQGAAVANIGVIMHMFNTAGLGEAFGVTENIIKTGPLKSSGAQWEKLTPDQRAMIQESIDDSFAIFLEAVSEGRQIDMATLIRESQLPKGRTNGGWFSARRALQHQLIDGIIPVEEFYKIAAKNLPDPKKWKTVEFVDYRVELDALESITKKAGHMSGTFLENVLSEMNHRDAPLRSERE